MGWVLEETCTLSGSRSTPVAASCLCLLGWGCGWGPVWVWGVCACLCVPFVVGGVCGCGGLFVNCIVVVSILFLFCGFV